MPRRLGGRQARKGKEGAQPTGAGQAQPQALALPGGEGPLSGGFLSAGPRPFPLLPPAAP